MIKNWFQVLLLLFLLSACAVKSVQIPVEHLDLAGEPISFARYQPIVSLNRHLAKAYEYVYLTQEKEKLVTASALYLLPKDANNQIVVFAHPTTGVSRSCGVDNSLYQWMLLKFISVLLEEKYIVILPNYRGLGISDAKHKFLQADEAAMDVLDASRAALTLFTMKSNTPIILWGYSQGGQATQRASEMASYYAPSLNILGSIQNSAPLLLSATWADMQTKNINILHYMLLPYIVSGAVRSINELDYSDFTKQRIFHNDNLDICGASSPLFLLVSNPLLDISKVPKEKMQLMQTYIKQQDAPKFSTKIPLLIIRGEEDKTVKPQWQSAVLPLLCAKQMTVSEVVRAGGHISEQDIAIALKWMKDRFLLKPAPNSCP